MKKHFHRWGVMYVLALMWVISTYLHYSHLRDVVVNEAKTHNQPFEEAEFRSAFIASTFENWQSEYMQLFVQAGLVVGLASVLFKKSEDSTDRIERKIHGL